MHTHILDISIIRGRLTRKEKQLFKTFFSVQKFKNKDHKF